MIINSTQEIVLVDGCRTPFQRVSSGYKGIQAYDLARETLKALRFRNPQIEVDMIDQVIMGCVVSNITTSNVARDAMLAAGYSLTTPAYTVTQACISANRAITNGIESILSGQANIVVAGGTDSMSDVPIRYRKAIRSRLLVSQKIKSPWGYLKLLKGLKLSDMLPEVPAIAEFSTGQSMGQDSDRLAARFSVSREEQDEFALRSHLNAATAWQQGWMDKEVIALRIAPHFKAINENTFRADSSLEKLASLKPAFVRPHGTVTAGNASALTDGAASSLIMSKTIAKELGYSAEIAIRGFHYSAQNPDGELLLGPACASAALLNESKLHLDDIDVFEFHEAFAGQVLANLNALDSVSFCTNHLGLSKAVGRIPMEKLNTGGGSLSLGHPFGATGSRLITTAANRLIRENTQYALIAACAAGGQGSAILLERVS